MNFASALFHLKEGTKSRENIGQVGGNWMVMKL